MMSRLSASIGALLCVLLLSTVAAETCITCKRDTLEECSAGEKAAEFATEFESQRQECSDSLPYCEVVVQEWLGSEEPGAEPQVRDVSRGCIQEERFTCTTAGDVRTCTATCQGHLCNDFEDVAARVQEYERKREEEEERKRQENSTPGWVVPVAVVVLLAAAAVLAVVGWKVCRALAGRRKARDLKMTEEAGQPLSGDKVAQ